MRAVALALLLTAACSNPPVAQNVESPGDVADDGDAAVGANLQPDVATDVAQDLALDAPADVSAGACPNAAMQILEGQAVVPQTLLHLKCDSSATTVAKCTLAVTQPTGSTAQAKPGNDANDFTFLPNVAGAYTFCPSVDYEDGAKNCALACLTVQVLPDQAIHGELIWNMPCAATATADELAQMGHPELHFASPFADDGEDQDCDGVADPWFDPKWDCSPYNPNPDWGSADPNIDDDPSWNADGAGPDGPHNLNLTVPEDGDTYAIGVRNLGSCGPSLADVRVYIYGNLSYENTRSLKPLDMWYVASFDWPTGDVYDKLGCACAIAGSKGPCIVACYKPPPGLNIPGDWTSTACP